MTLQLSAGQYRKNAVYGNPFLRLLRREVEALVERNHGGDYLRNRQIKAELASINRELKRLRTRIAAWKSVSTSRPPVA